jgi:hypothetical protein
MRWNQFQHFDLRFKSFEQLGCETHSARRVVSNRAVFNSDLEHD